MNQIASPQRAISAKIQSIRHLRQTATNAMEVMIPNPISIIPGIRKSGKNPCMIEMGMSISRPSGAAARRLPPERAPAASYPRMTSRTMRFQFFHRYSFLKSFLSFSMLADFYIFMILFRSFDLKLFRTH